MGAQDQPFIMVPNPNYVSHSVVLPPPPGSRPATSLEWAPPPPPSAQQPTILTMTPPSATDTEGPESSHRSQPNAPPPPPTVRMTEKFIWDKTHDAMTRNIFDHRMTRLLQQMIEDVRERYDHLTLWLHPDIKKALYVHWETDERFRCCCLTKKTNRALTKPSKYTGGLAAFMKTKSKLLDRDAMMAETFKCTHTLRENREMFVDQRSTITIRRPDTVWCETTSEPYKNHIYRLGLFFIDNLCTSTLRASSTSATSRAIDFKDSVIDLREQVLNLTQSLHQQAQQLQQFEERYNEILARVLDTDSLRLELRQELERLQRIKQ
ncbi:hypothetical protein Ahy_B03g064977 [Arachis hypogaea]|uniref:Uncharacterized protein n=1 Tax=Arachis hypogaea TaxID=3818 RepID=A0A445A0Q2_ARAHY|nr:hypothetical protein Ahy_B03g064977 [Arachis hypogaea]